MSSAGRSNSSSILSTRNPVIIAPVPVAKSRSHTLLPMSIPIGISNAFLLAPAIATVNSGSPVPSPTSSIPITDCFTPSIWARCTPFSTTVSEP